MTDFVPSSRFFMWRAVIAMAHADGIVRAEERELIDHYLGIIAFSREQRDQLDLDILEPQDCASLFKSITEPEDQQKFFEYARIMAWSDGDLHAQEEAIMDVLTSSDTQQLDLGSLRSSLRQSKASKPASLTGNSFAPLLKNILQKNGTGADHGAGGISDSRFYMWRSIFALAHIDEIVTVEEQSFLTDILNQLPFSAYQRGILQNDLEHPKDAIEMFHAVSDQNDRSQFFYFARLLSRCDGDFGPEEQELMTKLERLHVQEVDFSAMMRDVRLSLDEEKAPAAKQTSPSAGGGSLLEWLKRKIK
jgi:uncharacterized membrane protein YebE (DUF533 family)